MLLAVLFDLAGMGALFNVAKLLALTAIGFLFMQLFEALSWVVLIAIVIPWIDAVSVWRGPTDYVVSEQPSLFERVSIGFRLPGEEGVGEHRPTRHPLLRAVPRRRQTGSVSGCAGPGCRWSACSR